MFDGQIQKDGYNGSDSLLRTYLSKIKKEETKSKEINQIVERSTMITLLYKEIDKVTKRTLTEFKEKNGHALDIDQRVEEMENSLSKLAKSL